MRRSLVAAILVLLLLSWPAQAQVSEDALAPFIGKYGDGTGRHDAYITKSSGLIMTWYFGTGCAVDPHYPCDPANAQVGNVPGGMATVALWSAENGDLIGTVISTESPGLLDIGPLRVVRVDDQTIEIRQGETRQVFTRVR